MNSQTTNWVSRFLYSGTKTKSNVNDDMSNNSNIQNPLNEKKNIRKKVPIKHNKIESNKDYSLKASVQKFDNDKQ